MKKFIVERNIPGAGNLSPQELQTIAQTSCQIIEQMGKPYQWIESFITADKMYCIHIAETEQAVRLHSQLRKFPVNTISEVKMVFDPITFTPLS